MKIALAIASLLAIAGWFAFCVKLVKSKWERDRWRACSGRGGMTRKRKIASPNKYYVNSRRKRCGNNHAEQ